MQMPAKGLAEARELGVVGGGGKYFIKTFPFNMHFNRENGQFYQKFRVQTHFI